MKTKLMVINLINFIIVMFRFWSCMDQSDYSRNCSIFHFRTVFQPFHQFILHLNIKTSIIIIMIIKNKINRFWSIRKSRGTNKIVNLTKYKNQYVNLTEFNVLQKLQKQMFILENKNTVDLIQQFLNPPKILYRFYDTWVAYAKYCHFFFLKTLKNHVYCRHISVCVLQITLITEQY